MELEFIQTEADYYNAMKRIDELIALDPIAGTKQFEELDAISSLVESYEDIYYSIN